VVGRLVIGRHVRAFPFIGSDADYIIYLENLAMRNTTIRDATPSGSLLQLEQSLQISPPQLAFVYEDPSVDEGEAAQWVGKATRLISETPTATEWWSSLKKRKLDSLATNCTIISSILNGAPMDLISPAKQFRNSVASNLLSHITDYAMHIRQFRDIAKTVQMMHRFIFVCLCVVAIAEGVPEADVNKAMVRVITKGQDKYLSRIRKGAKWVNTLIDELNGCGWQNRASELLLLCM